MNGRIPVSKLTDFYVKEPESLFPAGTLVSVKVLSVDEKENRVELSMLPKDTGTRRTLIFQNIFRLISSTLLRPT